MKAKYLNYIQTITLRNYSSVPDYTAHSTRGYKPGQKPRTNRNETGDQTDTTHATLSLQHDISSLKYSKPLRLPLNHYFFDPSHFHPPSNLPLGPLIPKALINAQRRNTKPIPIRPTLSILITNLNSQRNIQSVRSTQPCANQPVCSRMLCAGALFADVHWLARVVFLAGGRGKRACCVAVGVD